jgi:outer membrane protein OmpA-like peptidoglycan-associated protein/outer membrane protein assembly factor BamB
MFYGKFNRLIFFRNGFFYVMKAHTKRFFSAVILCLISVTAVSASDWPIYKGNIFYTGNNDEITVKNNNLKWLFQASDMVYNPINSDGMIFFVDLKKNVYCLDEDSGKLKWKISLTELSRQFNPGGKAAGKVKYPLVKDNRLILTDSYVIYCLDKRNGKVLWARTGMRDEKELFDKDSLYNRKTSKWQMVDEKAWDPTKHSTTIVDGIYSDPVIHHDMIYYGTRNVFVSRGIEQGHLKWDNKSIRSYGGYPSFYDRYIFTQSMDYNTNRFMLYCLDADTGSVVWSDRIGKPVRIFSPVVYRRRVYLAAGSVIHCFKLEDGSRLWDRDYSDVITSNPSFTEREILFTTGNRQVVIISPDDGSVISRIDLGDRSSPYFVTIRDQIYVASTFKKTIGSRELSYALLRALRFDRKDSLWNFVPPFPGGAYQPAAAGGIMFLPAGNYLYAVGTDYYPHIIDGGSAAYDPYNKKGHGGESASVMPGATGKGGAREQVKEPELRTLKITVNGEGGSPLNAQVDVKRWDKGKVAYSDRVRVERKGQAIRVPNADDVEITADADGYIPKKVIISRKDKDVSISLEQIEKGKGIVVDNIHFEINSAYLKKESLNILDRMIEEMKKNKRIRLEIRGHTDSTGPHAYNMKLSERRADAVRDYMIKNGISPERLESSGYGPDRPIADNRTAEGRRKNRRTEFFILDK